MLSQGIVEAGKTGLYLGVYAAGTITTFSFDKTTGLVAAVVGGVLVGLSLGLPRAMPAIRDLMTTWLEFSAKMQTNKIARDTAKQKQEDEATQTRLDAQLNHEMRVKSAELKAQLEYENQMKGSLTEQVENLRELLESGAKERAELSEKLDEERHQRQEESRRRLEQDRIIQDLLTQLHGKVEEIHSDAKETARATQKIEKKVAGDRVLVIEDDKLARVALVRLLASKGCTTIQASTVEEAKLWLRDPAVQENLCFVLLDIILPGDARGGLEVLDKIKRLKLKCLVVVMTGLGDDAMLDDARRSFADLVVRKPIENFEALWDQMQALKLKAPRPSATDVDLAAIGSPPSGEMPTV